MFFFILIPVCSFPEVPLCKIAVISNPYITALPPEQIKEPWGKSRSWLKERSISGMENAIDIVNNIKPDLFIILGSLTWTGSDDDFIELKNYLGKIEVPYYTVPGQRDIKDGDGVYLKHFKDRDASLSSIKIKGVFLQFAIGNLEEEKLVEWMEEEFSSYKNPKGVILFGGPQIEKKVPWEEKYWKVILDNKVAVRITASHSHYVEYRKTLPIWSVPSTGWQTQWKLALITVYPKKIALSLICDLKQPFQTLTVPNPVSSPRMKSAEEDIYGVPTYTEDLLLKPEFTFIQLSDSQLDDLKIKRHAPRYKYAPQMNKVAIAQVNKLSPSLVFLTGDLVNKCTLEEWKMWKEIYSELKVPLYTLVGNHDFLYEIDTEEKLNKLGVLREVALSTWKYVRENLEKMGFKGPLSMYRKFTEKYVKGKLYYTVERNNCVFICLNTNKGSIEPAQIEWLKEELERTKNANHVFILGHYPLLKYFRREVPINKGAGEVLALMKKYKVAAYIFGHRHFYGYRMENGTAHILCDDLCWGEHVSYQIYHVFPDRIVSCWKPLFRSLGNRPLYERVIFPEPRYRKRK